MGYVTKDFGTLKSATMDSSYVVVTNEAGQSRKMSVGSYKESAEAVYAKAQELIGKEVRIRTSQNTNDWSTEVWFSEIYEK